MTKKDIRILALSAGDYAKSLWKDLSDYDIVGLEVRAAGTDMEEAANNYKYKILSEATSLGAEVVVDVKPSYSIVPADSLYEFYVTGTALVPKKNNTFK